MSFPLRIYKIEGHSMEPTILAGSFVLVWCWARSYKVADVIAFHHDNKIFIKRITSMSGDEVGVAGDNKTDSLDSRQFGLIVKSDVIGKVLQ